MSSDSIAKQWLELCDQANQAETKYAFERTFQNLREMRRIQKERDRVGRQLARCCPAQ
ncbi:hypothetical protein [Marinobacter bohaiensis]|uniref:hypothetical protein n=1 Tax=Marinobacter bohaiensis TaxID=2201898 RepID=UPI0013A6EADF|nr:hypothetical protein [Marinobacter bohaiensis]